MSIVVFKIQSMLMQRLAVLGLVQRIMSCTICSHLGLAAYSGPARSAGAHRPCAPCAPSKRVPCRSAAAA
eukprot:16428372-Heterocapsa_arctica.AAC.1